MAILRLNLRSHYLHGDTNITILVPQCSIDGNPEEYYKKKNKYQVLWLLHGGCDDDSGWVRKSNIELYAEEKNLIVVMPSAGLTYYTNWPELHHDFSDYFIKELMPLVYNWFPASAEQKDNFIAGLSMGGLGVLRFVATFPNLFSAAAAFSVGSVNLHDRTEAPLANNIKHFLSLANGGVYETINSPDNAWDRLVENKDKLPDIYVSCGTKDPHYEQVYLPFKRHMKEAQVGIEFREIEGYDHEWPLWDIEIKKFIERVSG